VFSPDDGHIVAQSMQRKSINILRKIVHHVGSSYKMYGVCEGHAAGGAVG